MSKEIDPAANPAGAAKAVSEAPSQADVDAFASKISDALGKQMGEMFTEYKAQLAEHAKAALEGSPGGASEVDAENIFKAKTASEWLADMGKAAGAQEDAKPTFSKALAHAVVRGIRDGGNGKVDFQKGYELAEKAGELKGFEVMCAKALGADDASAGGFLVQPQMAAEVIPSLLSETGVFGDPGIRRVPVNGQLEIPYETTAPTERWVAENAAANATEPVLDQLTLRPERVSIIVPTSKKLLRSTAMAANWIDMSIRRRFEERVDNQFIRSLGVSNTPTGLRYLAASANVLTVNATVSAANTDTDLLRLFQQIQSGNVPMTALRFMISPRSWRYLNALRGTDVYLYRQEMLAGRILGVPIAGQSGMGITNIPENLAVTDTSETEIYLYETSGLVMGIGDEMTMVQSDVAAYNDSSGTVQAALSRNQVVTALNAEVGLNEVYRGLGIAVLSDVDWGV